MRSSQRWSTLAVIAFVLLLRLPFLNQAVQGDDYYYLQGAMHAQVDPAHPLHTRYAFQGKIVDMRGHPHPPLDVWCLAGLIAIFGDIREGPFHAAYTVFSLIAALSALSIARRYTSRPLMATFLSCAAIPFVVNGNSFESDLPFLAFWLAAIALFLKALVNRSTVWLVAAAGASVLAAFAAYQSVLLTPLLLVYLWLSKSRWRAAWAIACVAPLTLLAWQAFERATSDQLPAAILAGYMQDYGLQSLINKFRNGAALLVHLGWIAFPALSIAAFWKLPRWGYALVAVTAAGFAFVDPHPLVWASAAAGCFVLLGCARTAWSGDFLGAWVVLFFAACLVLFFAGSARYLLPLAAPLAILVTRELEQHPAWLLSGFAMNLAIALALATVNYQHWDAYRAFARSLSDQTASQRVWVDAEWGLRHYLESDGALPLLEGAAHPGDAVAVSELSKYSEIPTGGTPLVIATREANSSIPLRIVTPHGPSAYSVAAWGFRPFDLTTEPMDHMQAVLLKETHPTLEWVPMNDPRASEQIVSGLYGAESNGWRWMSGKAALLLKVPAAPARLTVTFYIPDMAAVRIVRLYAGGKLAAEHRYPGPGSYTLTTEERYDTSEMAIEIDQTFSVPQDRRVLGMIVSGAGYRPE